MAPCPGVLGHGEGVVVVGAAAGTSDRNLAFRHPEDLERGRPCRPINKKLRNKPEDHKQLPAGLDEVRSAD
jgi:hypothetical protein